jgi:pimeloyl-ACP methyl ester carboxylesterase
MGSKDPDFSDPKVEVKWIEDNFHGLASSVMVEGAGHYPHVEYPDEVHKAIVGFLST